MPDARHTFQSFTMMITATSIAIIMVYYDDLVWIRQCLRAISVCAFPLISFLTLIRMVKGFD
ncbi:hypothetical protein DUNSADRAFT_5722 [Dunaliella salina]|uniref:Uncharacterized protein n=1 Tax=Dunaliella salina TaxID=3046 RepID=A0ABQ7FU57_DUNSA|nr:hypothetical protein DUNSADRAFT_5722 [Dunaliella salina]|eukprot:KAF5825944.1 hypothetical protein DUNSADRAFT_5722 [Dunaliella salina]